MNFKISKRIFLNALQLVARAVSSNSPIPSLSGIKLDIENDRIILTGSDSDISIKKELINDEDLKLDVIQTGSMVIDSRYLLEIVKRIDSDIVNFELIDGLLIKISGNEAEYQINGMRSSDYPVIDFKKPVNEFNIDAYALLKIINQTSYATSEKESRPLLCGVNFKCENNVVECVATDSYRLARKYFNIENELKFNVTIPKKSLNEIAHSIEKDSVINVAIDDKKAQFLIDNTIIQTRLIDGIYPETSRLIPTVFKNELVCDSRDILNAIDRASLMRSEGVYFVRLTASKNDIMISSKSQDVGSYSGNLNVESWSGDDLDITFSGKYVQDAIRTLESSNVCIRFAGDMKPFIITSLDDKSVLQLVLPVRTYN